MFRLEVLGSANWTLLIGCLWPSVRLWNMKFTPVYKFYVKYCYVTFMHKEEPCNAACLKHLQLNHYGKVCFHYLMKYFDKFKFENINITDAWCLFFTLLMWSFYQHESAYVTFVSTKCTLWIYWNLAKKHSILMKCKYLFRVWLQFIQDGCEFENRLLYFNAYKNADCLPCFFYCSSFLCWLDQRDLAFNNFFHV